MFAFKITHLKKNMFGKIVDAPKKLVAGFQKLPTLQKVAVIAAVALLGYWLYKNYYLKRAGREGMASGAVGAVGASGAGDEIHCTLYYTEWCPHCKSVKPEWHKLREALHGKQQSGKRIVIDMVDCEKDKAAAEAAGVQGFPTIKIAGQDYSGERTFGAFKQHIMSL